VGPGASSGGVEEVAQVGDQHCEGTYLGLTGRDRLELNPLQRPKHQHADDAHDRHKQSPVIVTLDDEPPCNSRHFE
jgi:hypothetical protein